MKKRCFALLLALMLLMGACPAHAAATVSLELLDYWMPEESTTYYCAIRAKDAAGNSVPLNTISFRGRVAGSAEWVELPAPEYIDHSRIGHIIVVDTSTFYYKISNIITEEHIRDIVYAYLDNIPNGNERVMFVLSLASGNPYPSKYMSVGEAREYIRANYHMADSPDTQINSAIRRAFELVTNASYDDDEPLFKSVFIVADPDLESNKSDSISLENCTWLRKNSNVSFDVTVAVVDRGQYNPTNPDMKKNIQNGKAVYQNFAMANQGKCILVPQDSNGVNTAGLVTYINQNNRCAYYLSVDTSLLAAQMPEDADKVSLEIAMSCGDTTFTKQVEVSRAAYPQVTPEPTETVTPEPTPSPSPTPVVMAGASDDNAMLAIVALKDLGYLEEIRPTFDEACRAAYIAFCKENGLPNTPSINSAGFVLLTSDSAKPKPTPEPTQTVTPEPQPELPPDGYRLGDADSGDSHFIHDMQLKLQSLNCYAENASKVLGTLDQSTMDAVARYCDYYGLENARVDGVDRNICDDILHGERQVVPTVEKTLSERVMAFLQQDVLYLGNFAVRGWMPLALVVFLVFLIIVILIIMRSGKQEEVEIPYTGGVSKGIPQTGGSVTPVTPGSNNMGDDEKTNAMGADGGFGGDGPTQPMGFAMAVTFNISYQGNDSVARASVNSNPVVRASIGEQPFLIGRERDNDLVLQDGTRTVSGHHAELTNVNGQLYIRDGYSKDGTSSTNGTSVNGRKISTEPDSDKTRAISSASTSSATMLNKGDTIEIGFYILRVDW